MVTQIFDKRTIGIPGTVTPAVEALRDEALQAATAAEGSASAAAVSATNAEASAAAAEAVGSTNDTIIAAQINTPGSASNAALIGHAFRTAFYDDFSTKPDGEILTGDLSDSGHAYGVRLGGPDANPSGTPPIIVSGSLTHVRTDLGTTQSFYLSTGDLGDRASRIGVEFTVPVGTDPAESLVLIVSLEDWTYPASNGDARSSAAAHFVFNDIDSNFETFEVGASPVNRPFNDNQSPWVRGVRSQISAEFRGNRVAVTMPDGRVLLSPEDEKYESQRGPYLTWQLDSPVGASTQILIHKIWGDTDKRTSLGTRSVQGMELARVAAQPGRMIAFAQTWNANAVVALTNTLSNTLYSAPQVPVPLSRRVLVKGLIQITQTIPTTQVDNPSLYVRVEAANSTWNGKQTVMSGNKTPANGTGATYTEVNAVPFAVEIDLTGLKPGQKVDFNVKAWASAGSLFSFQDSGDESGGSSTLRHSTIEIYELPVLA